MPRFGMIGGVWPRGVHGPPQFPDPPAGFAYVADESGKLIIDDEGAFILIEDE